MDKNEVVTISDWNKGMVKHPIYGFGLLKNVEVFESKGIAKLKPGSVATIPSDTPSGLPIAEVYDISGNTYTLTGNTGVGVFYRNGIEIQGPLTLAWDMVIYKDYVWVRHSSLLSCYGPISSGSPEWFDSVDTGYSSGSYGKLLVGQDDYLYSGNGNYVARIQVTASGTVAVAPTLSVNKTALDLPDGQYVVTLEEFGTKLIIGTQGGSTYSSKRTHQNARLYAWNRTLGTLGNPGLADIPIKFSENGINAIRQHANKLYVSAGTQGNIYVTDGTNYVKLVTLPYTLTGADYQSDVLPNAMSISQKGNLLVGVSSDLESGLYPGVYEIDLNDPSNPISYRSVSSMTNGTLKIGFINQTSYQTTKIGFSNNATYAVDTTFSETYSNYGGVIESPLIKVGRYNAKKTFQHIEWVLSEPLVTGQNIRISYRKNNREGWTVINTWGYSTQGGVISFEDVCAISDCEYIQLKIELDQATSVIYGYNINLISVSIW
jgi:hypothetical protein